MNIVVVGAGGVGGFFGAKLAKAGNDVTFIVRGKHLEAIQSNGLQIKSIEGDFRVHPKATNDISTIENPDLIILAVKSWQIEYIAIQLKGVITPKTMILPLQNGADNADKLRAILPHNNVIAGLCRIVSKIEAPGIINHFAFEPEIVFGEYDDSRTERMKSLKTLFDKAEFKNLWSENILLDIWKKFLFISTVSGIGAITRVEFGVFRQDENIRTLLYKTAKEIVAIANAKGIPLKDKHIELTMSVIDKLNYNTTASMQRDIMEGRPSELKNFNGYIVEQGQLLNIETPVNSFVYQCLLPMERKARGLA